MMWELIRVNKRKSLILFIGMGFFLILLGYMVGYVVLPKEGGIIGILIAFSIWLVLSFIGYFSGSSIILATSKAKKVTHDVHPRLFNIVEEMKIAANLPVMPEIYIIPDSAPNAFATGRNPGKSVIAVTAGLLSKLNRDELQGVIAHEMSHIMNRDVLYMTFAGILLGSIVLISEGFLRGMFYSSVSSRRYSSDGSSKNGNQSQLIFMVIAIVFAILAPLIARLFYFAISRKREYLADASAVRLTRYPEGLASALENISSTNLDLTSANRITAAMYIINPLKNKGMKLSDLTSTHPPITERIKILRSMVNGANYVNYQGAFTEVKGKSPNFIPASGLRDVEVIPIKKPSVEKQVKHEKAVRRDIGDLIMAMNKYVFLECKCGLKFKIPPDFKKSKIECPRCKREIDTSFAETATISKGMR